MVYPGSSVLWPNYRNSTTNSSSTCNSSVDCTLSLATPNSTTTRPHQSNRNNNNNVSCSWDLTRHYASSTDNLLTRRCANCDTTSTPLWRNGPRGPKSLCNACGIRFKKEERRAAAATTTTIDSTAQNNTYTWGTPQKIQYYRPNEFQFIDDVDRPGTDSPGVRLLSWFTHDRPTGLVNDFTR